MDILRLCGRSQSEAKKYFKDDRKGNGRQSRKTALEKYGRNLTEEAREGKLDAVIGRDIEIQRALQIPVSYTHLDVYKRQPMKTSDLGGVDSLYSIVQMPSGIPVATVAINGGQNLSLIHI